MKAYEDLLEELRSTQTRLAEERKQMASQIQKEREEMLLLAQAERRAQLEAYQAKVEEHEKRRQAEADAAEARRLQEVTSRMESDQVAAKADESYRLYHSKLEEIRKAIAEAEFSEEKHRKDIEDAKNRKVVTDNLVTGEEVNVEYPVAPLNIQHPGDVVEGAAGHVPEHPLMSAHLKQILRQATRSY